MFFVSQVSRLKEAGIQVFLISGNHDAENKMTRSLTLPEGVSFFSSEFAETSIIQELDVAVHGQSFSRPDIYEDLSQQYPLAVKGCFNIGILHTSATGLAGHDPYAPCTVDGLRLRGYDYWALGHIHRRQELCADPVIAFSGNIQGRHIRETGAKGCLLVKVEDDHRIISEFRPLDTVRWEIVQIDAADLKHTDDLLDKVHQQLRSMRQRSDGLPQAVRIELNGMTTLHRDLQARREHWTNEFRSIAIDVGLGEIWIEKVKFLTREVIRRDAQVDESSIGELKTLFDSVRQNPEMMGEMGFELEKAKQKLPVEIRDLLDLSDNDQLCDLINEAEAIVLEKLLGDHFKKQ